jgi:hypothetical protein
VGNDPESGVIIPLYYPPKGYSPASMHFIRQMGYDHKTFTAAGVNLAVKGLLRIEEHDGHYELVKTDRVGQELVAGENALMKKLFSKGSKVVLENSNHALISAAIAVHKKSLKTDYEKKYFFTIASG